jgi:predicted DNA-binding transcriptional regulator YafY
MLVSLTVAEKVGSSILLGDTRSIAGYTALPDTITGPLLEAFANRRIAVIRYQDEQGSTTEREIELQYLYYSVPVWYARVWDRLRDDVRTLRMDRIKHVRLLDDYFKLRSQDRFLSTGEPSARAL